MLGLSRVFYIPLLLIATCSQNESPPADAVAAAAPQAPVLVENPTKVGECAERTIAEIADFSGGKLSRKPIKKGVIDPGSYVRYTNKDTQVSYEWDAALAHSKVGDKVRFCLVSIPKDCPPGDNRGRVYETTNLRTNGVWKMQDDPHMCGGA
ncbi:conserved hypothetical protein [Bradyrhizobium sp. STM 3843]|nr:conserved hypothetical protein [Bradyrhizobium sp. STM 3843]